MNLPPVTSELAMRIENVEISSYVTRLKALQTLEGNPYEIDIHTFDGATALLSRKSFSFTSRRVLGTILEREEALEEIITWYHTNGFPCRFEIAPVSASETLFRHLARRGFYQSGFYTALYGIPSPSAFEYPAQVTVREVGAEEAEMLAKIFTEGFGFPATTQEEYTHMYRNTDRSGITILVMLGKLRRQWLTCTSTMASGP